LNSSVSVSVLVSEFCDLTLGVAWFWSGDFGLADVSVCHMLLPAAGLCNSRHWYLAASVEGHLRVAGAELQRAECHNSAHFRWSSHSDYWILRLLWSDHGEQVHASDGTECCLTVGWY